MAFEEIKAGLDRYMKGVKAKLNKTENLSAKYIVKEHSSLIDDGNDLFYVYAHYPTTEPDVMVMTFTNKVNAEMFCEALNAENERRTADTVKHGEWLGSGKKLYYLQCSHCESDVPFAPEPPYGHPYCPRCGAKMDEVKK